MSSSTNLPARDKPSTHCPDYKRQRGCEYKGNRPFKVCRTKHGHPHEAPRSSDRVARFKVVTHVGSQEDEREDQCAAKDPHDPTRQERSCSYSLVSPNFLKEAYWNGFHCLTPVPHRAVFPQVLLGEIAEESFVVGA